MRFGPVHRIPVDRSEQIILFRCSSQLFAISSASVQEVRSVDSLAGLATEINVPSVRRVRHMLQRGERSIYIVNLALHFELKPSPATLIFLLRKSRVALLLDGIEKMTAMTRLQALPVAFCNEERNWYRGLTVLEQNVLPVINPMGFLTVEEFQQLDLATEKNRQEDVTPSVAPELGLAL